MAPKGRTSFGWLNMASPAAPSRKPRTPEPATVVTRAPGPESGCSLRTRWPAECMKKMSQPQSQAFSPPNPERPGAWLLHFGSVLLAVVQPKPASSQRVSFR